MCILSPDYPEIIKERADWIIDRIENLYINLSLGLTGPGAMGLYLGYAGTFLGTTDSSSSSIGFAYYWQTSPNYDVSYQ